MSIGVDEVGRGCFAGPLVVSAVHLTTTIDGLRDSKKLSEAKRIKLETQIRYAAEAIYIAWISPAKIDEVGLSEAMRHAVMQCLSPLSKVDATIVIDGNINYAPDDARTIAQIGADDSVPSVMAASIIAKQARDRYMRAQHTQFPEYNFASNVGYGTGPHRAAIEEIGVSPLHRLSYKPLQKYAAVTGKYR